MEGDKPSPFPAKVFTERYPAVKYPYSVVKHKAYSQFGLGIEEEIAAALQVAYKDKFVGDLPPKVLDPETRRSRFGYLSEKDADATLPLITEYTKNVVAYFLTWYPPHNISRISYQTELELNRDEAAPTTEEVVGHPDIMVWLDDHEVVIYDIKVFARTTVSLNKNIRLQICSYAALARSQGLTCNYVGVIMPWARVDTPVKDFDISKWKESRFVDVLIKVTPNVLNESMHYLEWSILLKGYGVGAHIHRDTAIKISRSPGEPVKIPFQIFLYGNNPSASMEAKGQSEMAKIKPDFSANNIFVHAPYNVTLASPGLYIIEAIKTYLEDSYRVGARGVVFHTGHHPDTAEGLKIMKKNMEAVIPFIHPETPLIIETPCGNKNEMLATPSEFSDFLLWCPEHLVGACIDTCHVFVSGFLPLEYIMELNGGSLTMDPSTDPSHLTRRALDQVCLIHFNGSRKKIGCCADGHAHVTTLNHIPDNQLEGVLAVALHLGIPCVTE